MSKTLKLRKGIILPKSCPTCEYLGRGEVPVVRYISENGGHYRRCMDYTQCGTYWRMLDDGHWEFGISEAILKRTP